MNIIRIGKEQCSELGINIDNCRDVLIFKEEESLIGYGVIKADIRVENAIEIFVYEEFRSNGYGTKIFGYLYDELKKLEVRDLLFVIDNRNIRFINIICKYNAIHLGTNDGMAKYIVPIK